MQNQTEITIGKGENAVKYGILFNNLAIMEAETSFGVDLRNFNFMKSATEMTILIYCGIVAFCAKYRVKPIDWIEFYEMAENNEIEPTQVASIVETFRDSTVVTEFIKTVSDALEKINKDQSVEKKKEARALLKKGK